MQSSRLANARGQSLVQILIVMGIAIVFMGGATSMIISQNKEVRALSEKVAAMDLQRSMEEYFSDADLCSYTIQKSGAIFDATRLSSAASREIKFNQIQMKASPTAPPLVEVNSPVSNFAASLITRSIKLKINSGGGSVYQGQWVIEFDDNKTVRAVKPAIIATTLYVDPSNPTNAKITACKR